MFFSDDDTDGFDSEIPEQIRHWIEAQREKSKIELPYYILINGKIKTVPLMEWAIWFDDFHNRRIDYTEINKDVYVSTVFLGLDHSFNFYDLENHRPILFETMVFGGKFDKRMWRYSSYGEAKRGHWEIVDCVKEGRKPDVSVGERPWIDEFFEMLEEEDRDNEDI